MRLSALEGAIQGVHCARCILTSTVRGAEVGRETSPVQLQGSGCSTETLSIAVSALITPEKNTEI